jgi:hypothetical protein
MRRPQNIDPDRVSLIGGGSITRDGLTASDGTVYLSGEFGFPRNIGVRRDQVECLDQADYAA